jgi:hypothetical protein
MNLPVILSPAADREFGEAAAWYERQTGLGEQFVEQVQETLDQISRTPSFARRSTRISDVPVFGGSRTECIIASRKIESK